MEALFPQIISKNLKNKIHETWILTVVMYDCKTRSLRLREGNRVEIFERKIKRLKKKNKVLFPKKYEYCLLYHTVVKCSLSLKKGTQAKDI